MYSTPLLEQCAEEIYTAAKVISGYCLVADKPQLSFDPEAESVKVASDAPQNVLKARQRLITATTKIQQLVTEPSEYLPNLQVHYQHLACIRWLCHFHILPCIPLHGSVPYTELASLSNVPVGQLQSVCRMAMTSDFLCEPQAGEVAHNNVSSTFITNPGLVDWATFMTQFSMPAAAKMVEATEKWGQTEAKNQTAVNIAMDTDLPLFDFIGKSPDMTKQFAAYMKNVQNSEGTHIRHLIHCYDWASLGDAVVVDVGGSTCSSSVTLANAFPTLRFIVQDLPDTIANSTEILASQPESVQARIAVCAHSFFSSQTVYEARVYLLRMILHDWPAAEAIAILKNHLKVLKSNPTSRIVIMDTVLPPAGSLCRREEALLRVRDLTMIQAFNSKERELSEFADLFAKAADDEGCLVLKSCVKPPGSVMSALEVAYERFDGRGTASNGSLDQLTVKDTFADEQPLSDLTLGPKARSGSLFLQNGFGSSRHGSDAGLVNGNGLSNGI